VEELQPVSWQLQSFSCSKHSQWCLYLTGSLRHAARMSTMERRAARQTAAAPQARTVLIALPPSLSKDYKGSAGTPVCLVHSHFSTRFTNHESRSLGSCDSQLGAIWLGFQHRHVGSGPKRPWLDQMQHSYFFWQSVGSVEEEVLPVSMQEQPCSCSLQVQWNLYVSGSRFRHAARASTMKRRAARQTAAAPQARAVFIAPPLR
jgi:hypothetical protein